jgi:predicted nucleic acid-binding protein
VSSIVLDAGALIALERNDRELWGALKLSASRSADVIVPSTVVAQVWRATASQAQLARALQHCVIASFDSVARAVGELCGRSKTKDICDAHVAIVAAAHADVLYTSDPTDLRRLLSIQGGKRPKLIRC